MLSDQTSLSLNLLYHHRAQLRRKEREIGTNYALSWIIIFLQIYSPYAGRTEYEPNT